ncbi:hypothetical protein BJV74DRAFT_844134 [Russula compacta]|nr:hypothetical protein BJV74DRAFT_844134 [Russula compacta]
MLHSSRAHKVEAKFNVITEFPHLGLHAAAATGNIGLAKYALSHGQPINSVIDGVLPLHAACSGGNDMVVRLLIDNGADVNAPRLPRRFSDKSRSPSTTIIGTSGSTPLHFAAANGHTQVVLTLLRHGARPDRADKRGDTPEGLARKLGWLACADTIVDWIANKDRDLVERETLLGSIPLDDPESISQSHEHNSSLCSCERPECVSIHVMRRLGLRRSIENIVHTGTSPQDGTVPMPDSTWPSPESLDSSASSRRPSLQPSDDPVSPRRSHGRPRRPSSAGNGAERPHHPNSRRLGSKYSLLNLFKKPSTEMLSSTHNTPGAATPDVSLGTSSSTSNTTSLPTSPLSSSPPTLASELNESGQSGSPPSRPDMLRSNAVPSGSSVGVPSVSISASQPPQSSRSLRFNSSESTVPFGGKSPRRAALGQSPGPDGRLSEESEDEDEEEEYGADAVRSHMMSGDASTQDMDLPFSIGVPVEAELLGLSDVRGRGDSLSTNLSATTASTSSLRTPFAIPVTLSSTSDEQPDAHTHRPPPLTGLSASNVSTHAQAEALVALARGQVLTAQEGDEIPLSARLAALGESLQLERKFKEAKESASAGLLIERRASESTALDTADAEPWEHDWAPGVKMRSASASAGAGASFDMSSARRLASGLGSAGSDRNFNLDYRVGHSWGRGRPIRPNTTESAQSSDDGFLVPHSDSAVHHRSRSAAPARPQGDDTRTSPEMRVIHPPRLARAPSLDQSSSSEATVPSPGIKSAPLATTSPSLLSRSRTPDPDYTHGPPLTRIVTAPPQDSSLFDFVVPSPVDLARRGNEDAQALSRRANKLAKMGFAPEVKVKVLSTGVATPPGHGHGQGHHHRFGFRSLVQSLKGK